MVKVCVKKFSPTHWHVWEMMKPDKYRCINTEVGAKCPYHGYMYHEPDYCVSLPYSWADFINEVYSTWRELRTRYGSLPIPVVSILNQACTRLSEKGIFYP